MIKHVTLQNNLTETFNKLTQAYKDLVLSGSNNFLGGKWYIWMTESLLKMIFKQNVDEVNHNFILFIDFSKTFVSIHGGNMKQMVFPKKLLTL